MVLPVTAELRNWNHRYSLDQVNFLMPIHRFQSLNFLENGVGCCFENIYLVSDSNLVSKNKNTLNSNLNKKLNILSKKKVINKIILFSFDDTIININNVNFQIKAKNPSEIGSLNTNELEIISKKKIYILKILDSENNSI